MQAQHRIVRGHVDDVDTLVREDAPLQVTAVAQLTRRPR